MSRREQMPAHERFKLSYFGDSRHGQHTPREPRMPRMIEARDVCNVCGVARAKGEHGWWAGSRRFHHFACVTDSMLDAHRAAWGHTPAEDKVLKARRGR